MPVTAEELRSITQDTKVLVRGHRVTVLAVDLAASQGPSAKVRFSDGASVLVADRERWVLLSELDWAPDAPSTPDVDPYEQVRRAIEFVESFMRAHFPVPATVNVTPEGDAFGLRWEPKRIVGTLAGHLTWGAEMPTRLAGRPEAGSTSPMSGAPFDVRCAALHALPKLFAACTVAHTEYLRTAKLAAAAARDAVEACSLQLNTAPAEKA